MRAIAGRPVLMQRHPQGATGPSFFQKRVPKNAPEWLQTAVVSTPNGTTSNALVVGRHRARGLGGEPRLPRAPRVAVDAPTRWRSRTSCGSTSTRSAASTFAMVREAASEVAGAAARARDGRRCPRRRATAGSTSTCGSTPEQDSLRGALGGGRPGARARAAAARSRHGRRGGRRSAATGCSSTSTRTRRTRRSSARGRCARGPAGRCRRRSSGTSSRRSTRTCSRSRRCRRGSRPTAIRGTRDRGAAVAGAVARAARAGHARRADGRAVAAGVSEDAERAAPGRAVAGAQAGRGRVTGERRRAAARAARGRNDPTFGQWCRTPARASMAGLCPCHAGMSDAPGPGARLGGPQWWARWLSHWRRSRGRASRSRRPPASSRRTGMDQGSGTTLADLSGNGNAGTISGATWATAGRFGGALSFNGSTEHRHGAGLGLAGPHARA